MAAIMFFSVLFVVFNFVSGNYDCDENKNCKECLNYAGCVWCVDENITMTGCRSRNDSMTCPGGIEDRIMKMIEKEDELYVEVGLGETIVQLNQTRNKYDYLVENTENQDIKLTLEDQKLIVVTDLCYALRSYQFYLKSSYDNSVLTINMELRCDESCGCEYNQNKQTLSKCMSHGYMECGACLCDNNWDGIYCEQCRNSRADTSLNCFKNNVDCSGRGRCVCDKCLCNPDVRFPNSYCEEICAYTNDCVNCYLELNQMNHEECSDRCIGIKNVHKNEKYYKENGTLSNNTESCFAMRRYNYTAVYYGVGSVAVVLNFEDEIPEAIVVGTEFPVVIPIVLALLLTALILGAAYAVYSRQATPNYVMTALNQEDDPDTIYGENPIYKEPVRIYNNPTYKK